MKINSIGSLALLVSSLFATAAWAQDGSVDFSCMKVQVRPIIQVTDRHKEYDVVVRNKCPGDVYWAMCIERMDPWTHKVIEPHYPAGAVQADGKARVNLQMKNTPNKAGDKARFQEFYVSTAYALQPPAEAPCVAKSCEAKKADVRKRIQVNDKAWQKARAALEARVEQECPDDGWNGQATEDCRERVRRAANEEMEAFAETNAVLMAEMAAVDPEVCALNGGDTVEME
jgi:hypothetical protein